MSLAFGNTLEIIEFSCEEHSKEDEVLTSITAIDEKI